jgi:hypothetical protein
MAVKKSAGSKGSASKKAAKKGAAKKAAKKAGAAKTKTGAAKKAGKKKASAAPVKLSTSQTELLRKVGGASEPGYRFEKKAEQRTLDALHERKLIKRGPKHKESGSYHYTISNTGKKHLDSQGGGAAASSSPSGGM